jgi:hypothetical protein
VILTAPLKLMAALLVIVTAVKLVELPLPKAPTLIIPPAAFKVSVSAEPPAVPSVVPVMVRAPLPEVKTTDAASAIVNAPPILKVVLVVVMLFAKFAAPVVLKPLGAVMAPVAPFVNVPLLVTATLPVAAKLLFTEKAVPLKTAEPTDTVLLKVVVPVAALVWVKAPVILTTPLKLMAALLVIVTAVKLVELPLPKAPTLIMPPAAFNVSASAKLPAVPSVDPVIVRAPLPEVKTTDAASAIVKAPPILKVVLVVVMLFAKLTAPVVLKPPAAVMAPVAPFVNVPLLVTATLPVDVKLLFTA